MRKTFRIILALVPAIAVSPGLAQIDRSDRTNKIIPPIYYPPPSGPLAQNRLSGPPPRMIIPGSCRSPDYSAAAREMKEEGTVRLGLRIDAGGHPVEGRIEKSSGFTDLDKAALDGLLHC